MNDPKLQKVSIDFYIFFRAFARDVDFEDTHPQSTYLDLQNGDILWVYEDDEEASWNGIKRKE
jgi:hypothetical protein